MVQPNVDTDGKTGIWSKEHGGIPRQRWTVSRGTYSVSNEQYRYDVTLREAEEFSIETLVVDGIETKPFRYAEEIRGDLLFVRALVWLEATDRDRVRDLIESGEYFQVVRRGINESPVEMRFGMTAWSEHDGRYKYSLHLVDRAYDKAS